MLVEPATMRDTRTTSCRGRSRIVRRDDLAPKAQVASQGIFEEDSSRPSFAQRCLAALAVAAAAGCAGTQEAEKSMATQYLGKPSDTFFARYGAAQSSTKLNS